MADVMFHDHTSQNAIAGMQAQVIDKAELDRLLSNAYAQGRNDAFTFLGLDEKDFPEGDGLLGWTG